MHHSLLSKDDLVENVLQGKKEKIQMEKGTPNTYNYQNKFLVIFPILVMINDFFLCL